MEHLRISKIEHTKVGRKFHYASKMLKFLKMTQLSKSVSIIRTLEKRSFSIKNYIFMHLKKPVLYEIGTFSIKIHVKFT